jgi:PPOX class probable F420-dependent enzyme
MDLNRARDFLRENHRAVMATYHSSGRLQLSPVTVGVDDAGRAIVSTRETAVKVRNLARDPRVAFCLMNDGFFGEWMQLDGEATIVRLPAAMELLVDYYRGISGEHPDWADYRAAMEREKRVVIQVTLTHVGPDFHG